MTKCGLSQKHIIGFTLYIKLINITHLVITTLRCLITPIVADKTFNEIQQLQILLCIY